MTTNPTIEQMRIEINKLYEEAQADQKRAYLLLSPVTELRYRAGKVTALWEVIQMLHRFQTAPAIKTL